MSRIRSRRGLCVRRLHAPLVLGRAAELRLPQWQAAEQLVDRRDTEPVRRVARKGQRVTLTRRGKAVAAIVSTDDLALLEALEERGDVDPGTRGSTASRWLPLPTALRSGTCATCTAERPSGAACRLNRSM